MKYTTIFLLFILGGLTSCSKFLDTEASDFYTPQNYYDTEAQLNEALNGIYGVMTTPSLYGQVLPFNFVSTNDEILTNRAADGDTRGLGYTFDASNTYVAGIWRYCYTGIANANMLLENIGKPAMNETARGYVKGQALFLRAYFYFILSTNFGDVPLLLANPSITEVDIPATPQAEVFAQIENDLKEAETLLAGRTVATLQYNDEVTLTAVQAMLARVYLYWAGYPLYDTEKYAQVITYADKVIGSGLHTLNPDYKQIFINLCQDKYDTGENILEWGFRGAAAGISNKTCDIGNFIGVLSSYIPGDTASYTGAAWAYTTRKLFDSYEVDDASASSPKASPDLRRDWNCANYYYTGNPRVKAYRTNLWQYYAGKFRREYCPQDYRQNGTYNINWPAIRYSDVLLMKAEAENQVHNGPTEAAYLAINQVRRRGYGILYGNILKSITVTNGGSGYSAANPPAVAISGGGGTGAAATAVVSADGVVTGITITRKGTLTQAGPYFTSAPAVTIAAPASGGTAATATAVITSATDADLTAGLSKAAFHQAIRDERMRELCGEGYRKADLVRWGRFYEDMQEFGAWAAANGGSGGNSNGYTRIFNIAQRHVLLPKPTYELNLNKALVQNPGW